jgi:universal stress protein E
MERTTMQHVLVATDLSERAQKAVQRGLGLARRYRAPLTVLHVVDPDQPLELRDEALDSHRAWLEEALGRQDTEGIEVAIEVVPGPPDGTIVEFARTTGADLVVMGAHRRHLLRDVFVGTTIERVIRGTERPVLMVNRDPSVDYDKALVAVDFSAISERMISVAASLEFLGAATVILLHGYQAIGKPVLAAGGAEQKVIDAHEAETASEALGELRRLADRHARSGPSSSRARVELRPLLEEGPALDVIERVAEREAAPLVVIGSRSHTGMLRFLLGSTAEGYLRSTTTTDVLVVSPPSGA